MSKGIERSRRPDNKLVKLLSASVLLLILASNSNNVLDFVFARKRADVRDDISTVLVDSPHDGDALKMRNEKGEKQSSSAGDTNRFGEDSSFAKATERSREDMKDCDTYVVLPLETGSENEHNEIDGNEANEGNADLSRESDDLDKSADIPWALQMRLHDLKERKSLLTAAIKFMNDSPEYEEFPITIINPSNRGYWPIPDIRANNIPADFTKSAAYNKFWEIFSREYIDLCDLSYKLFDFKTHQNIKAKIYDYLDLLLKLGVLTERDYENLASCLDRQFDYVDLIVSEINAQLSMSHVDWALISNNLESLKNNSNIDSEEEIVSVCRMLLLLVERINADLERGVDLGSDAKTALARASLVMRQDSLKDRKKLVKVRSIIQKISDASYLKRMSTEIDEWMKDVNNASSDSERWNVMSAKIDGMLKYLMSGTDGENEKNTVYAQQLLDHLLKVAVIRSSVQHESEWIKDSILLLTSYPANESFLSEFLNEQEKSFDEALLRANKQALEVLYEALPGGHEHELRLKMLLERIG